MAARRASGGGRDRDDDRRRATAEPASPLHRVKPDAANAAYRSGHGNSGHRGSIRATTPTLAAARLGGRRISSAPASGSGRAAAGFPRRQPGSWESTWAPGSERTVRIAGIVRYQRHRRRHSPRADRGGEKGGVDSATLAADNGAAPRGRLRRPGLQSTMLSSVLRADCEAIFAEIRRVLRPGKSSFDTRARPPWNRHTRRCLWRSCGRVRQAGAGQPVDHRHPADSRSWRRYRSHSAGRWRRCRC
jgi:hypothetical protein